MFNNIFFPKKSAVYEIMSKKLCSQKNQKWRHKMVHTSCMLDKQDYMNVRSCTRAHAQNYVIFIAFPQKNNSRTRLNITWNVHYSSFLSQSRIMRRLPVMASHAVYEFLSSWLIKRVCRVKIMLWRFLNFTDFKTSLNASDLEFTT